MLSSFELALAVSLALALMLAPAGPAAAQDLGSQTPLKIPGTYPENVPSPLRQGGDTIETAVVIPALPFSDTGTTAGFVDDYDETCPYDGMAPDVVYQYLSPLAQAVTIDLCGSSYDTKVYVYDGDLNLIACNDDYYFQGDPCGLYVSRLDDVPFAADVLYYIIVDGYGGDAGDYLLAIEAFVPCVLECPAGAFAEGEPPLVDDYLDEYNSGCGGIETPFQVLAGDENGDLTLCGVSGWYTAGGGQSRDTDWFLLHAGAGAGITVTADAEYATYLFELGPQDCASVAVVQQITAGPCMPATMTITGYTPDAPVWFWAGSTVFSPPSGADTMYDYVVWFGGLAPGPVATEPSVWGAVKSLWK